MWKRTSLGMVLALSLFLAGPIRAVPITFAFTGTVTGVRDDGPYLDGSIVSGTSFSGTYTFESSTPDDYPDDSWRGQYTLPASPEFALRLRIGAYDLVVPLESIGVENGDKDAYGLRSRPFAFGSKEALIRFSYGDLTGSVFDTDHLPIEPFDIARFNNFGGFNFQSVDQVGDSFSVGGQLTSIIPEPQSGALLLIGFVAAWARRKR